MKTYILDTSPLLDKKIFEKYYTECSDYRKQKIDALKKESDRCLSLGVEILLAHGMSERDLLPYEIRTTSSGKPYAENTNVHFSLSHSGKYAVAAFSESSIGIDIEVPKKVNLKLSKRFFSAYEQRILSETQDKELEFLKIWTRKEAILKASDIPFTGKFSDICTAESEIRFNKENYILSTISQQDYVLSCAFSGTSKFAVPENIIIT